MQIASKTIASFRLEPIVICGKEPKNFNNRLSFEQRMWAASNHGLCGRATYADCERRRYWRDSDQSPRCTKAAGRVCPP